MRIPFFKKLEDSKTVLLAGAGGGFDVFAGLPLYFWLKRTGKTVHLAGLSFTELGFCEGDRPVPSLLRVTPASSGPPNYFPEVHLSQWLSGRFGETSVYAIERGGARTVLAAYEWLVNDLHPDTILLVDGGMDSLMRGDEAGLGTPQEDIASLLAADKVAGVDQKLLACIGFGIDTFHGICHAHFLENVASLIKEDGYLGAWSLTQDMEEFRFYEEASAFVLARMRNNPSIVQTSIIAAAIGCFGDHHSTNRTEGSRLFINPLMSIYWGFELQHVARRNLYLEQIAGTETYQQLSMAIEKFRALLPKTRPWVEIPC